MNFAREPLCREKSRQPKIEKAVCEFTFSVEARSNQGMNEGGNNQNGESQVEDLEATLERITATLMQRVDEQQQALLALQTQFESGFQEVTNMIKEQNEQVHTRAEALLTEIRQVYQRNEAWEQRLASLKGRFTQFYTHMDPTTQVN